MTKFIQILISFTFSFKNYNIISIHFTNGRFSIECTLLSLKFSVLILMNFQQEDIQYSITLATYISTLQNHLDAPLLIKGLLLVPRV